MEKLTPKAVIAQWMNAERTRGYMLQANGVLVAITRESPSDMWSPPNVVGPLNGGSASFENYLHSLV